MKITLKFIIATAAILACSLWAGSLENNYFLGLGLLIVMASSFASIASASAGALKAWRAAKIKYEVPNSDSQKSHAFKFTAGMMGVNRQDPLETIRKQIDELRKVAAQDEENWRKLIEITNYRIDICLARLEYHESVTLPKMLGSGAGTVIVSAVMAFVGSAFLAYPDGFYDLFRQTYASLAHLTAGLIPTSQ